MIALVLRLSLLHSVGFYQSVHDPTHCFNHILNLVLAYGIEYLIVFPQNPLLSDHFLINFMFLLLDYMSFGKNSLGVNLIVLNSKI